MEVISGIVLSFPDSDTHRFQEAICETVLVLSEMETYCLCIELCTVSLYLIALDRKPYYFIDS